jgi:membrane protein required for colicin V production
MNWLDIIVLILIAVPTVIGLKIGIIKALFTVAGVIVGVVLAGRYAVSLAGLLTFISDPGLARVAAFTIILIGVMVIAVVLAAVIKLVISAVLLGWVNRLGGAVFGFVLGAVFCGAFLTMWVKFLGINGTITDSALARFLLNGFPVILALLPADFDSVRSFFR